MSEPRDDAVFVDDISSAINRIESYLEGLSEEAFFSSTLVQDAVIRQLEVIGEAAKRLSAQFRRENASIPWTDIIGMRGKLAHDYMTVDLQTVWDTTQQDIPALKSMLAEVESRPGSNGV